MYSDQFIFLMHFLPDQQEFSIVTKRIQLEARAAPEEVEEFGERLATFRRAAGFTQVELAAELSISQRMVAYYESPNATPPASLLPAIASALGVSIDELFGVGAKKRLVKQDGDNRLRRRLLAIEKLETADRRQVIQLLDAFIERSILKRKIESRA
jgi:transcriptional regulator with XRE-family HTH domain